MLSLYVHIPFCVKKCRYCGFYSTPCEQGLVSGYLAGLRTEAAQSRADIVAREIDALYIGGGTPTALNETQLGELFHIFIQNFAFSADCERTVEVNPNTAVSALQVLRRHGVNRLSVGIQSFSDRVLGYLGRVHTASQAVETVHEARASGFGNIGIDLIYGIPGMSDACWQETLAQAVDLAPEHVSAYGLSLDEGSFFAQEAAAGRFSLPDDGQVAAQYDMAADALTRAGYEHYEISNFAKPGFSCRHNVNYWDRGEYRGLGPSAWSFIGNRRFVNIADVAEYARRLRSGLSVVREEEMVDSQRAAVEALMLGLRKSAGILLDSYERNFGPDARKNLERNVTMLAQEGLLLADDGRISLTRRGMLLSNEVLARLL